VELENKVEELETLLDTASRENTVAASRMNKMEGELLYYRGLLYGAANNQRNGFITSYPNSEQRSSASQLPHGGDIPPYGTVPAYSYAPSIPSLMAPALAADYQRAESYDSSSSSSYSPTDSPLEYSRPVGDARTTPPERVDSSMWAYLQFNTAEPVEDGSYRE
jgi:hypothetical protein